MEKRDPREGAVLTSEGAAEPDLVPVAKAKHLPLAPLVPLPATPPDLVPARMINEVNYCERLLYLEWSQGEFADNYFTVDGRYAHRRADQPGGALPPVPAAPVQGDGSEPDPDEEPLPYTARQVWLSSEALGMTAKIDVVEQAVAWVARMRWPSRKKVQMW